MKLRGKRGPYTEFGRIQIIGFCKFCNFQMYRDESGDYSNNPDCQCELSLLLEDGDIPKQKKGEDLFDRCKKIGVIDNNGVFHPPNKK